VSGLSFSWLQKIYIGKNCLNKFRQDNGYKEGTYIKVWNKDEDNVVMIKILEESSNISFDTMYEKLQEQYDNIK
jgi:cell division protein FtsI/penicillin-binding protein 2